MQATLEVTEGGEVRQRKKTLGNSSAMLEVEEEREDKTQTHIGKPTPSALRELDFSELVHETKRELLREFNRSIDTVFDGLITQASLKEDILQSEQMSNGWMVDRNSTSNGDLPEKVFKMRESVLTKLFQVNHIRTVYHLFIATLIIFVMNIVIQDSYEHKTILHLHHWNFFLFTLDGFNETVLCWIIMQIATFLLPFNGFLLWCHLKCELKCTVYRMTSTDWIAIAVYIIYQVVFTLLPLRYILIKSIPPIGTFIVLIENIRMVLKSHAFIRSSAGQFISQLKLIKDKRYNSKENRQPTVAFEYAIRHSLPVKPNFSQYLYFLFAPTLIYRTSYPRTTSIRWDYVVSNMTQVVGCVFFCYYIFFRFCFATFSKLGRTSDFTLEQYILMSTSCTLPGGLVMLLAFFASLHSWLNAFAEMLRFGDRLFYKDWWNVSTFSTWYRTWNVVVHDWLYTYVYRDILLWRSPKARGLATGMVFLLSAAVHEYALTITLRFFYPVLFTFFACVGYAFYFVKGSGRGWNVALWIMLFFGWGQMMCLYSMEWYARKNCEPVFNAWLDFVTPHSWFCTPKH